MRKFIIRLVYFLLPSYEQYHKFMKTHTGGVTYINFVSFGLRKKYKNEGQYWPIHKDSEITHPKRIFVGINSNVGTRPGCYIQGNGGVWIGNYVRFASNIGIISGNHDIYNQLIHNNKEVRIEDYCWIGMNAIVLPGVHLGPRTIVGAGSVVTKSFPNGFCVIGGNPAKLIKELDREQFIPTKYEEEFYGFVSKEKFKTYTQKYLRDNIYYEKIIEKINSD